MEHILHVHEYPQRDNCAIRPSHHITKENKKNTKNILRGYQKLINGNVSEFVNHIYYGDELWFRFKENKFFLEG